MSFLPEKIFESILSEIRKISEYLIMKDWAEASSGNFSIRVHDQFDFTIPDSAELFPSNFPNLKKSLYIVSASGARWRDIAENPVNNICLIIFDDNGTGYKVLNNSGADLIPTSELNSHLNIHVSKKTSGAVLHIHPTELIALTHKKELCSEVILNETLKRMHPEKYFFY